MVERSIVLIIGLVCVAVGFGFGVIAGYFGPGDDDSPNDTMIKALTREADDTIAERLLKEINANNIRANLKYLTTNPHLAGTPADLELATYLKNFWQSNGLKTYLVPFQVLLSYPNFTNPNKVTLLDGQDGILHTSRTTEEILLPEDNKTNIVPHFNGYSPPGDVSGDLVYVNYARIGDFDSLKRDYSIDVAGKICIARYGKIFRGDKAKFAQANGCIGLILYSDPKDYAAGGTDLQFYPNTWWLPGSGVQRGTVKGIGIGEGDPLTLGYPATDEAFRRDASLADEIPKIPIQPIGYADALEFLRHMGGNEVPTDWRGALNVTYNFGPGFTNSTWKIRLQSFNKNELRTTYNTFGVIEGSIEPDRYVLMGNHRDAWVFGSVDPSSGTASMMEISRAMSVLYKQGWRPRRTIIFCSWGAEEYGLIGSSEWVEEHRHVLSARAVAYINLDIAVEGNVTMMCHGIPSLSDVAYNAAKFVPNPNSTEVNVGRKTLYDTWQRYIPERTQTGLQTGRPEIPPLGSGSDHAPFLGKVGVPALDFSFTYDPALAVGSYPPYHSTYDTFHLSTLIDSTFEYHQAMSRVVAECIRNLADSHVLPFNFTEYAHALQLNLQLLEQGYGQDIRNNVSPASMEHLSKAIANFTAAASGFLGITNAVDKANPLYVRKVNDQMATLERMFVDPFGLPQRADTRHLIYAPSSFDGYSGTSFPGVTDTVYLARLNSTTENWNNVAKQMAAVTYAINAAASSLRDVNNFMSLRVA